MSKIYARIDRDVIKEKYFNKLISEVITRVSGLEDASVLIPATCKALGLTYKNQLDIIKDSTKRPTFMKAYMESLMDTIDSCVESYVISHNGLFRIDEDKIHLANEAASEDLFNSDNADDLGGTLSDMVEEMLDKKLNDIKDIAKLVIRMEKDKQDSDKENMLEENSEIEEENSEDPFGDTEEGENNEEGGGEDGDNPFSSDDNEGNNTESGGEDSETSDNPFEGTSEDASGDGNGSGNSDNPFDDGESAEGGSSEGGSDNPFEDGGSEQSGDSSNNEGSGNPFESINDISKITIGGKTPFYSLRNGDLTKYVTLNTRKVFEEPMKKAFDEFGQESVQFKDLAGKLQKTNRAALESLIAVASVGTVLGFNIDMSKIKYCEVFLQD